MQPLRSGHLFCRRVLLLLALALALGPAQASDLEVITNPDHASVDIDRNLLRTIFTMRTRTWPDGEAVKVFVLPDSNSVHDQFSREFLGIYPYILRSTWDRMVYTGTGFAPETVRSEAEMREKVRLTPGAIGYARKMRGAAASTPTGLIKVTSHGQ